jgi:DNA end-binding protein Ku
LVPRGNIDPVYFDSPYYLYPDGPIAVEMLRVIGAAMAEAGIVGIGRLTLSRRERIVMVEPRGTGMALFTLRAADEVRTPQFSSADGELDVEMVAIARAIIAQRTGAFDPSKYRDHYQEALRELIEAKLKGLRIKPRAVTEAPPVIELMAALKRSLAKEAPAKAGRAGKVQRTKATPDRRQASLLFTGLRRTKKKGAAWRGAQHRRYETTQKGSMLVDLEHWLPCRRLQTRSGRDRSFSHFVLKPRMTDAFIYRRRNL